jgi:hypothetical protein
MAKDTKTKDYKTFTELQYHPWAVIQREYEAKLKEKQERHYYTLLDIMCDLCQAMYLDIRYIRHKKDYIKHLSELRQKN